MILVILPLLALIAGFLNGIGASGGVLMMSGLIISGLSPIEASALNKICALFGSIGALKTFFKDKSLLKTIKPSSIIFSIIGAIIGAISALIINNQFLGRLFSILITGFFIFDLTKKFWLKPTTSKVMHNYNQDRIYSSSISFFSGIYNGVFGPGTLTLSMIPFQVIFGLSVLESLRIATVLNTTTNLTAAIIFSKETIPAISTSFLILFIAMIANLIGQTLGSKFATKVNNNLALAISYFSIIGLILTLIIKYWLN
ncbi:MAG: sulfite exporter TauE/SafE family protein [Neisseriales bacterium]|nr:MAG: sulfite exporter TauE/SafE family protein [Neisseriales bacterium]